MQINDYKYYQYHRNNGITKIGLVRNDGSNKTKAISENGEIIDTGLTEYITSPVEGSMALTDRMN